MYKSIAFTNKCINYKISHKLMYQKSSVQPQCVYTENNRLQFIIESGHKNVVNNNTLFMYKVSLLKATWYSLYNSPVLIGRLV